MYEGATSVIVRDLNPAALVTMIGELGITHGFIVPAVLQFMLAMPGAEEGVDVTFSAADADVL